MGVARDFGIIAVVVVIAAISALAFNQGADANAILGARETVKIGAILNLTGPSSDNGQNVRNGIELALENLNSRAGRKYDYIILFEDSQYAPATGLTGMNKLVNVDNVHYVIGAYGSSVTNAIAPVAEQNRVLLMIPASMDPKLSNAGDFIFRINVTTAQEAGFFSEYLRSHTGGEKIDIIAINTDFGTSYVGDFSREFGKLGGKIGVVQFVESKETDFRTQLLKIRDSGASRTLLLLTRVQTGIALKQAKELGLDQNFFGSSITFGEELVKTAGNSADGLIGPYPYDGKSPAPAQARFRKEFLKKFGKENEMFAANGYDSLMLIAGCIESNGNAPEKVRDCLYATKGYEGASGTFSFDSNGDVEKPFIVQIVKDGKFVKYE